MASMISLKSGGQEPFKNFFNDMDVIKSIPENHVVDANYPIIAKGNRIEGIEAKE